MIGISVKFTYTDNVSWICGDNINFYEWGLVIFLLLCTTYCHDSLWWIPIMCQKTKPFPKKNSRYLNLFKTIFGWKFKEDCKISPCLHRYPIIEIAFHPFALNGYPQRVAHGDWWAGMNISARFDLFLTFLPSLAISPTQWDSLNLYLIAYWKLQR